MEEERKEQEVEVVEEKKQSGMNDGDKNALVGFILTVVASHFAVSGIAAIVGVILVFVANPFNQKGKDSNHKVFRVFNKISRIALPYVLIVAAIVFVVALIVAIVKAIAD